MNRLPETLDFPNDVRHLGELRDHAQLRGIAKGAAKVDHRDRLDRDSNLPDLPNGVASGLPRRPVGPPRNDGG